MASTNDTPTIEGEGPSASKKSVTSTPGQPCKAVSVEAFSSPLTYRQQENVYLGDETQGRWLGPMPPEDFLSEFLPLPHGVPAKKEICFQDVAAAPNEAALAAAFIKAANEADLPRLRFVNTASSGNPNLRKLGPDVTGVSDKTHVRYIGKKPNDGDPEDQKAEVDFGYSELIVECKSKRLDDAFNDPPPKGAKVVASGSGAKERQAEGQEPAKNFCTQEETCEESTPLPFEHGTMAACAIRGQLATYAAVQNRAQFRTHSFSLFIFGPFARFIRWDRRCAIVSARFEYGTSPNNYLADFLHRHSQLDDEGRGKDTTLAPEPCSAGDCPPDMAEQLHKANKLKVTSATPRKTELRKVFIPDQQDPDKLHLHIISYPLPFVTPSPFGRGTRPFLAYNPATKRIVFAKDYWRSTGEGITKEGDIYKELKDKGVRHIAPFGHGNDIAGQKTIDLSKYEWAKDAPSPLQHYRMSLKVIGAQLQDFAPTKVLVSAVADAMEGHDDAFWDANILHRDISVGNILVAKDQAQYRAENAPADEEVDTIQVDSGLLIDWDMSLVIRDTGRPREERTGTWEFISAALLRLTRQGREAPVVHTIEDDRESSLYVILYVALRYSLHHVNLDELPAAELEMFEERFTMPDGFSTGGQLKMRFILTSPYSIKLNPPLDAIIDGAADFFRPRYAPIRDKDIAAYERIKASGKCDDMSIFVYGHYLAGMERMKARGAWVKFLREELEGPGWRPDDFQIRQLRTVRSVYGLKRRMWYSEAPGTERAAALVCNKRAKLGSGATGPAGPEQAAF
ncbi:hypothetical protein FA15DRAFT_412308 [Coprinopsis marcescibilis]|uniref:Fungal-type protein kinase domain-containing protein n=1 Tax=Coprinopsis marcescibilis TaxID=230819 RepID=A0A5C3KVZ2_COPMA|nr:hypothetical protein FA15DRAFT_412308 [Coprinopsis marcescibilis]